MILNKLKLLHFSFWKPAYVATPWDYESFLKVYKDTLLGYTAS